MRAGVDARDETDLRSGGSWTLTQRAKNDVLWALASLFLAGARNLPIGALRRLGRGLGLAAHALGRGPRRTAEANVRRVFPDLDASGRARLVRRCFATLGEMLGETVGSLRLRGAPPLLEISREAHAILSDARREGRGVVFPSAHLGPWERVAASLVGAGIPLVTLARESYDPRFSRLYDELRGAKGVGVVWRSSPGAAARILRTLRAGHVLGIPMDLSSRVECCDAAFLGHPASTPVGPARIALRTGSPVVVGTAAPHPTAVVDSACPQGAWIVTATRIRTDDLAGDPGGAVELTRRINSELSRRILAAPHAWVWMHDRWSGEEEAPNRGMVRPRGERS